MNPLLNVYSLPKLVDEKELRDGTVVVIDVLRASTTIVTALAAGAREVVPCQEIDQARAAAAEFAPDDVLLAGERHALPIDGFDLGNSPDDFTPETVHGCSIVFTTTNGTWALARCRLAQRVLLGSFVNASAVLDRLVGVEQIHLLCAGTDGQMSYDDVLCAGLLVERLRQRAEIPYKLNAEAITAGETWRHAFALPITLGAEPLRPERLAAKLRESLGGQNLIDAGLDHDILTAAQLDRFDLVPEMDPATMWITAGKR
ncbi:MAG TPA: 2-phosphosulfolactate phosphatase [Thermoguttaceae bacterium]|nr:2-phosphosulfolactate phosphatase [Thermoguttaceae bacterium]